MHDFSHKREPLAVAVFAFDVISRPTQHVFFAAGLLAAAWKWKADLRPRQAKFTWAAAALLLACPVLPRFGTPMMVQALLVFLAEWGFLITWVTMIFNGP